MQRISIKNAMKKVFSLAIIAMCMIGCNQNEPEKSVTTNLEGRVYFFLQKGEQYDLEYYLLFKPDHVVVDSSAMKWHIEPTGIDVTDPVIWTYTLDGELLTLHNENNYPYTGDYYATYRDSVIYKGSLVYRKQ